MLVASPDGASVKWGGERGTVSTRAIPATANTTVSQKMPFRPSSMASGTDRPTEARNALPIPIPNNAMMRGRR